MNRDLINYGCCGSAGAYAFSLVAKPWDNSTAPPRKGFYRNSLFYFGEIFKIKILHSFKFSVISKLYYNIMRKNSACAEKLCFLKEIFEEGKIEIYKVRDAYVFLLL